MTIDQPKFPGVNPEVPYSTFEDSAESKYWVGRVDDSSLDGSLLNAIGKFRANVMVREMGFLPAQVLDSSGFEFDQEDKRSTHFVVIENTSDTLEKRARLVGYCRLILKDSIDSLLPIENQFAEIFKDNPAKSGSLEVSRFISRHEEDITQHTIGLAVIRAMTYHALRQDIDSAYYEIEKPLYNLLRYIGLPMAQLGSSKEVIEPGGKRKLYPIGINPFSIIESVKTDAHDNVLLRDFFRLEHENEGIGFYPSTLVGGTNGR